MKKYLAYYENEWPANIAELTAVENKPFVGYLKGEGVVYTVIPEEPTSAYQMVDLGLSVKWADRNVGAETPQDYGLYFSWGNVDGHAVDENNNVIDGYSFDSSIYPTTLGGQYTGSTLDAEHDAATVNMGEEWRMPTTSECTELLQNTNHYYIGKDGNIVANSKLSFDKELRSICFVKKGEVFDYNIRGNFIEIPFAGYCDGSLLSLDGRYGYVLSSKGSESNMEAMFYLSLNSGGNPGCVGGPGRENGHSVRGVQA